MSDIVFSSGRELWGAVYGVIGIGEDGRAYGGYDSYLSANDEPLTREERAELADQMIARWLEFKNASDLSSG